MVSYALIPDEGYRKAIRREYSILIEKQSALKLKKIAKAAPFVGSFRFSLVSELRNGVLTVLNLSPEDFK